MNFFVIGEEDILLGFELVGIEGALGRTVEECNSAFEMAASNRDVGIILISRQSAEMIREKVDQFLMTEQFPLILEIPSPNEAAGEKPSLKKIISEAIGIKL